ncbi:MAG: type II secretion system protein [Methylococcales bacterium]|nr:type II secretion system protein [Methylococcales bacterium]
MNTKLYSQKGFSLLEILIAFSILALSLGVLLNIFSGGLRRAVISDEYQQAITIAQSILSKAGIEEELQDGETHGEELEKYQWTQLIQAFEVDGMEPETTGIFPYHVTVTVEWEAGENNRHVELVTLKLSGEKNEK